MTMIITTVCNSCLQPYQLQISSAENSLMTQIVEENHLCKCPRLCGGKIILKQEPNILEGLKNSRLREPLHLTGTQLYQAVFGMGCPDEIPKDKFVVEAVLKSAKVIEWEVAEEDDGCIYLHSVKLDNGSTLHLTSGSKGAQILKLTKGGPNGAASSG